MHSASIFGRPAACKLPAALLRRAVPMLLLCSGLPLHAQIGSRLSQLHQPSTLPATAPTTAATTAAAPATTQAPPPPARRAEVVFANGKLTVRADNSSLHQILYSISQLTGMTINGGVEDQRVFGSYGPGDASTILATLLEGTGVNLFIREGDAHQPTELVLTPRAGGPAPAITASDAQIGSNDPVAPSDDSAVHELAPGDSMPLPTANAAPSQPSAAADSSQSPASSGPLTPNEVYQKILAMQKARSGTSDTNPPSSSTSPGAGTPQ